MAPQKGHPIELTQYLYTRLAQLGVQTIYGTTWDTNSIVQTNPGQRYIRNVNEAHAAYAADAYAHMKGLAALVNTHGPNQSTTNDVLLAAHSQNVPIVHIVGYASTGANHLRNFRTVQIGSLDQVVAYNSVVVLGVCDNIAHAPMWIDATLRSCVVSGQPVYIGVPIAYAECLVDGGRLELGLLDELMAQDASTNSPAGEKHLAEAILGHLQQAKNAVVIVDGDVIRQNIQDVVRELVVRTGLPTFVTLEGREAIDTAVPNGGLYDGLQSAPDVKKRVGEADLLVHIGPCNAHVNAQRLHYLRFPSKIGIHTDKHLIGRTMSYGVDARSLLQAVLARLDQTTLSPGPIPPSNWIGDPLDRIVLDNDGAFTRHNIYTRVLKWMRHGDILISHFSIGEAQNCVHHAIWERKDVAFAACLGIAMASKELGNARRIFVFLDTQYCKHASHELATILQSGLAPIVFITREAPGMECLEDEDEFVEKGPEDGDSMAELGLSGHYQMNCIQTRRQLSDFLDNMDTSCLQIVELILDSPS